ncbi:NAD(P)-dependent oxidoreductase [Pullulanibacillus sp. KACC 23026]|uniref:NAD(P)-dependent oxidoreductase n=1 Tax=Pullulanibacillus sp. KACC 23026 TaxID=3028315 RepID=UPI0023AF0608|nr:NAD(P)-dependent oxidoreductase [Pullulanibacillus sp. KACC 23026]WEG11847.1 NAD(P)-dependent oxidoreductase [Pullulanibacillus sp. KACC 23026]
MTKIAFIGLGIMGSRMALNLLKAEVPLIVHNRTKDKANELIEKGAEWASTPKEAIEKADIVFTMLSTPQIVEDVYYSDQGLKAGFKKGTLWVDSSTVNPSFSEKMAEEAASIGVRFLDAPVSGSLVPAEKGELIFLVGGTKADFDEAKPYFDIMGKVSHFLGENGKGSSMKLLINLLLAQSMATFTETLRLGEAMGFPQTQLLETLLNHPVTPPILAGKKSKWINDDYSPEFPLKHMHKDLHLVAETAFELNRAMPLANAAKEVFAQAKQKGLGDLDLSALYKSIE